MNNSSSGQQAGMGQTPDINNDEIDLFELWSGLVKQKWLIISVAVISVMLAAAYPFLVTPSYKSTAYLLPPTVEDIQEMNALNLLVGKAFYKEKDVYKNFLEKLASREVKQQVFTEFDLVYLYDVKFSTYQGVQK
ncbi:MAG: Wzz/FepE/Etk N-terminal domain-containing protein [Pseudomonadota bacterium]|nr:Wzz/FepE/Etk N-terminal domain-containing protein [Pseudomonadota bacterium]